MINTIILKMFFHQVAKQEPGRTYRPIENYDYYDDSHEKFVNKYQEDTKVIVHGKGKFLKCDKGNGDSFSSFMTAVKTGNGQSERDLHICAFISEEYKGLVQN